MKKEIEDKIKQDLIDAANTKIARLSNPKTELLIGQIGEDEGHPVYGLFMSDPDKSNEKEVAVNILQEVDLGLLKQHFDCEDGDLLN